MDRHAQSVRIDEAVLGRFVPIDTLPAEHRRELLEHADLLELEPGESIGEDYDPARHTLYLLDGELELYTGKRRQERLVGGSEAARFALTRLASRQLSARAATPVHLLRLSRSLLSTLLIWVLSSESDAAGGGTPAAAGRPAAEWLARLLDSELFARIPPPNIQHIFDLVQTVDVAAGETVVRQREPGDYYYIVREGRCEVTRRPTPRAQALRLAELGPGDTFGEEALITGARRNATVRMLSDGKLLRLTKADFERLVKSPMLDEVSREEAEELIRQGAAWLDVRFPVEHRHDGLPDSLNIPLTEIRRRAASLDPERGYVVYCNSGRRSAAAAFLLNERGFAAHVLRGGLAAAEEKRAAPAAAEKAPDPATLRDALMRADAELNQALQQKAEAELARRRLAQELDRRAEPGAREAAGQPDRVGAPSPAELERVTGLSTRAGEALGRAQRRKLELEAALREAEAEAARQRVRAEALCQKLREDADQRLQQEEERLQAEYARAAAEMDKLRRARREAEARFEQQRKRLESELAEARSRLEGEVQRLRGEMNRSRRTTETKAEEIREQQRSAEHRLRSETETRLRAERNRLEAEFARSLEQQEHARRMLERAEDVRRVAEAEAARMASEMAAAEQRRQQQAETRRRSEMERLRRLSEQAEQRLARARRAREAAHAAWAGRRRQAEEPRPRAPAAEAPDDPARAAFEAELRELQANLEKTGADVAAAERARAQAEQERRALEERAAQERALEQELKLQLQEQTEKFLLDEQERSEQELRKAQLYAERMEHMRAEAEARARADEGRDLMSDIQSQLQGPRSDSGDAAYAEQRASLARSAYEQAAADSEKTRLSLERAREQVEKLRRAARESGDED